MTVKGTDIQEQEVGGEGFSSSQRNIKGNSIWSNQTYKAIRLTLTLRLIFIFKSSYSFHKYFTRCVRCSRPCAWRAILQLLTTLRWNLHLPFILKWLREKYRHILQVRVLECWHLLNLDGRHTGVHHTILLIYLHDWSGHYKKLT